MGGRRAPGATGWLALLALVAGACGQAPKLAGGAGGPASPGVPIESTSTMASAAVTGTSNPATTSAGPASGTTAPSTTARSAPTTGTTATTTPSSTTATAGSGGLTIALSATPSRPRTGQSVAFTLQATEQHATGALSYQVSFGDGATDQNPVPMFCQAGPGSPETQTWQLSHAYSRAGTYTVTATVRANCTSDQESVTVVESVG